MPKKPKLADRLIEPIRSIIARILPGYAKKLLNDPEVRERIVSEVDTTLINEYPAARAIPENLRSRIITRVLNLVLGAPGTRTRGAAEPEPPSLKALELSEEDLLQLEMTAPGNSVHGFLMDAESAKDAAVKKAVAEVLGAGWTVVRLHPELETYRATHPKSLLSVPEAWTLAHKLEDHAAIARAEPEIEWIPAPASIGGAPPNVRSRLRGSASMDSHLKCSGPVDWHLALVDAAGAWALSKTAGKPEKGFGVTIGHLDTGITHHAEVPLTDTRVLLSKGRNIYDPERTNSRPVDPMDGDFGDFAKTGFPANNGHGTATISILIGQKKLKGSAPRAKVIPFRIGPSVVHFDSYRISEGIRLAHEAGCDVITMSMGGPPSKTRYLDNIVARAVEDGVIICTAAGNQIGSNNLTPLVVWPAALDEVIAVAGCNCQSNVWSGSSRGPEVNITAGAEDVWRAKAIAGTMSPGPVQGEDIGQGEGTSFATPTVAGLAACWLAHHGGRKELAKHYGHPRYIPQAFARLLRTVAFRKPDGWNTKLMGPGILNASKLISAPLPAKATLNGWPRKEHPWFGKLVGGIFLGLGARGKARGLPASGMPVEAFAERFGGELAYLAFDRPALVEMLLASREVRGGRPGTRGVDDEEADGGELEEATSLLRSVASEQLAKALSLP